MIGFDMSKAFTRESDELQAEPIITRPASTLPPGVKNEITANCSLCCLFQEELNHLLEERTRVAAGSGSIDVKHQLALLEQRVAQLQQSLQTAVVVPRPQGPEERVKFGATVTVRSRSGEEDRYRIVGVDEMDIDRGWISFLSPIARALMNARVGQRIPLKLPTGAEELDILRIEYE